MRRLVVANRLKDPWQIDRTDCILRRTTVSFLHGRGIICRQSYGGLRKLRRLACRPLFATLQQGRLLDPVLAADFRRQFQRLRNAAHIVSAPRCNLRVACHSERSQMLGKRSADTANGRQVVRLVEASASARSAMLSESPLMERKWSIASPTSFHDLRTALPAISFSCRSPMEATEASSWAETLSRVAMMLVRSWSITACTSTFRQRCSSAPWLRVAGWIAFVCTAPARSMQNTIRCPLRQPRGLSVSPGTAARRRPWRSLWSRRHPRGHSLLAQDV